jgi:hypothetical protein
MGREFQLMEGSIRKTGSGFSMGDGASANDGMAVSMLSACWFKAILNKMDRGNYKR